MTTVAHKRNWRQSVRGASCMQPSALNGSLSCAVGLDEVSNTMWKGQCYLVAHSVANFAISVCGVSQCNGDSV